MTIDHNVGDQFERMAKCTLCGFVSSEINLKHRHLKNKHDIGLFTCDLCPEASPFKTMNFFVSHLKDDHPLLSLEERKSLEKDGI